MRKLFFIHPPSLARMPFTGAAAVRLQSGFFRGIIIKTKSTILRKTPSPLLARALLPGAQRRKLLLEYRKRYPRFRRLPVQDQVLKALARDEL